MPEAKYMPTAASTPATIHAPGTFRYTTSTPAISRPTTPSTAAVCIQRQCHGNRPNRVGTKASESTHPIQRFSPPPVRERIQRRPTLPIQSGSKNAASPMACSSRSLVHAPNRPIQLRTACAWVVSTAVFSEGSVG